MILILGSGVAGLACALACALDSVERGDASRGRREHGAEVVIVTTGELRRDAAAGESGVGGGNTALAQGGIAAALGPTDSPEAHARDTLAAGVSLTDPEAAAVLTTRGAAAVRALLAEGFPADRRADGALSLGLEAAHSLPRIVHAGEDRTGAALHAHLASRVLTLVEDGRIRLLEHSRAVSQLTDSGAASGAVIADDAGRVFTLRADAVVVATGGFAGLYPRTSNHAGALGEGIVLAARAGAVVADLEFVQFHPTVLAGTGFLVSEAVRGAGAVLRNSAGERFMTAAHPAAELAPRDVVARSIHREMQRRGEASVWLDATAIEREHGRGSLARRFPRITAAVAARGRDWAREPIEVSPAAHYTMGGVATDLCGKTSVPGLFAAGETASIGVHGANRLASNSLLEGLVFGRRAAFAAVEYAARGEWSIGGGLTNLLQSVRSLPEPPGLSATEPQGPVLSAPSAQTRDAVASGLGIERDETGLAELVRSLGALGGTHNELAVMAAVAAAARTESRGAHQRSDYPETRSDLAKRFAWAFPTAGSPQDLAQQTRSLAVC